ncbi:hypothetical protein DAEQUDRAFT_659508 [Daedalea quercina L-15889]|uniref:FAD-binding FR-type domain-containing protein n=1 Tax=Daedalea quercina L-15889 TaxID=1314783 RepID=A0A165UFB5_9APHY|nr:hypothetical protein DAEQUDRAFT_659508 [Daedalea quercina L-15889]
MGGGVPWLDAPVMLHSSREDTCTLTPEQCAYRDGFWRYWYQSDHRYALTTVYFMIAMIGLFIVGRVLARIDAPSLRRNALWRRAHAWLRAIGYRGFRIQRLRWYSPSLGYLLVALAGTVFFFGLTLGPKPYYWPNTKTLSYGSSPPLATRAGWMGLALLPFVIVLAAKANWATVVTGISHEKLQVFHRYCSYAMLVLALVHTFPFIVYHIWYGDMMEQWRTDLDYWTGVAALIPQAWLTFMSFGPIRNRYYEFFKSTHYLAALVFVLFLFFHCDFRLSSWDYFIATGCLYVSSLLFSQIRTFFAYGTSHKAHLAIIPGEMIQVTIPVRKAASAIPVNMTWGPGQHMFVRFLGLGWCSISSHPFTISSLPPAHDSKEEPVLKFVVRPGSGVTAKLYQLAKTSPGLGVHVTLDGPYGGMSRSLERFDRVLVVAGGSGAGFTLPVIEAVLRSNVTRAGVGTGDEKHSGRSATQLRVVVTTRDARARDWYTAELAALLAAYGTRAGGGEDALVHATVYLTGLAAADASIPSLLAGRSSSSEDGDKDKQLTEPSVAAAGIAWHDGRPDLPALVNTCARAGGGAMAVTVCGPANMQYDVRNAAAAVQSAVVANGSGGASEVYMHTEPFA